MDQVSDKKNKEENWIEAIFLRKLWINFPREHNIIKLRFFEGKTKWRLLRR